jgi:hypothetical protein
MAVTAPQIILTGFALRRILISAPTGCFSTPPGLATTHLDGARHDRINHIKNTERLAVSSPVRVAFIHTERET